MKTKTYNVSILQDITDSFNNSFGRHDYFFTVVHLHMKEKGAEVGQYH